MIHSILFRNIFKEIVIRSDSKKRIKRTKR